MDFILKNEQAILFECGYSCDNVIFASLGGDKFFITDGRYNVEAKNKAKAEVIIIKNQRELSKTLLNICAKKHIKQLCIDPKDFTIHDFNEINTGEINFIFKSNFSQLKRIIKSKEEQEKLKKAALLGKQCFNEFALFVKKEGFNMSEYELNFNASNIFRQRGKCGLSFPPIVAINANAAKAHALPTEDRLKHGDLLLLDAGLTLDNYCSDLTRTAEFNEDGWECDKTKVGFKDPFKQEIYDLVLLAHLKTIAAAKVGMKSRDLDLVARKVIADAGYGEHFYHGTGHGIGLDIHELPVIAVGSDFTLLEGMVFTIEPGIYLEGKFGVRIEEAILLTEKGAVVL